MSFMLSFGVFAQAEDNAEMMNESEYENGCSNELDDDLDGQIDSDDSDCDDGVILALEDFSASDLQGVLVWGVGIAILSTVGSDSGTGTATTN